MTATSAELLELFDRVVASVQEALSVVELHDSWRVKGERAGQYGLDLHADAAGLAILDAAGVGVLSEESGRHRPDAAVCVVVDPVDGSTNASRRIPWFATSLCAVDAEGPWVAQVTNLATDTTWRAVRGEGATRDGAPIEVSPVEALGAAVVLVNGYPPERLGWRQFRALGATALDLCMVADGSADGYVDFGGGALGPWDYLGGMLIAQEAGGVVAARSGGLLSLDHSSRRSVLAAGTSTLLAELADAPVAGGQRS